MSRIFISHASGDSRAAAALAQWLYDQEPQLVGEIHLGIGAGRRWKGDLLRSNSRCEAVICLLSQNWEASQQCVTEYRTAEGLGKRIVCARLEDLPESGVTGEWQRCDLFAEGPRTEIETAGGHLVRFNTNALHLLRTAIADSGQGPENFEWPPVGDPERAPYRGWEPFDLVDAGVFYGRDAAIVRGIDGLRVMRMSGVKSLFVVLGPSGSGKSSFLRAGLIPRLQREDRRFVVLGVVRPERNALSGQQGLAVAIHAARRRMKLAGARLGEIKNACGDPVRVTELLAELRTAAAHRVADASYDGRPPTLVLPVDQAEELFTSDAGAPADVFLTVIAEVLARMNTVDVGLIVAVTIRTDRYEAMQAHPALNGLDSMLFDECKPMPPTEFRKVITGPASRSGEAGVPVRMAPDLVARLIQDASGGADTLPLLSLTLARLYTDWVDEGGEELTTAHYEAMGGMKDVVNNEIELVLASAAQDRPTSLALLRAAFVPWLATVSPDSDTPTRRVALYHDLPEGSRALIDALVSRRLMVRGERDGDITVEVALESLLRQWDDLANWLREERQDLLIAEDIDRHAAAWLGHDSDPAWLMTGTRLTDAETVSRRDEFSVRLADARVYLDACRQAEDGKRAVEQRHRQVELQRARERQLTAEAQAAVLRKRSRLLQSVLAGTAIIAAVATLMATFAVINLGQARAARHQAQTRFIEATALQLQSEASDMLDGSVPGGDWRAFQELLAATHLSGSATGPSLQYAAMARASTAKIINAGAEVTAVAFSPDGHLLITGGFDNTVRIWDWENAELARDPLIGHTGVVRSIAMSPHGGLAASGSDDGTVRLWDVRTGEMIGSPLTGHTGAVSTVAMSPDGRLLASGGDDGTVRLWDVSTAQPVGSPLTGHTAAVTDVKFSPDGRRLVSSGGTADGTIRLWDVRTGKPLGSPFAGDSGDVSGINGVAFSADGRLLASAGADRTVRVWDALTGQSLGPPMEGHDSAVFSVAFSPDGRRLASAGADRRISLWNPLNGQKLGASLYGHGDMVYDLAFSPDGHRLASASSDGTARLWDANQPLIGPSEAIGDLAISPDGLQVAGASWDHTVWLWDPVTGRPRGAPLSGHTDQVLAVTFSPDGRRLASAGLDRTIRLWDPDSGDQAGPALTAGAGVRDIAFSPDGRLLASGDTDGTIQLWSVDSGDALGDALTGHRDDISALAFSPDGRRLASSSYDRSIRLWDVEDHTQIGDPLTTRTGEVYSVAFSPDGRRLVSANYDHMIRLWDVDTGDLIGDPLVGHTDIVYDAVFSPDGRLIASAGRDGTVRLWDAQTRAPLFAPLSGHSSSVLSVVFSRDGQRLISSGYDTTVRTWPLTADPNPLCDKLMTNMARSQWREWVSPEIPYAAPCGGSPTPPDTVRLSTVELIPFWGLSAPTGVAVDRRGRVYVADYDHGRVLELDRSGGQSENRVRRFGRNAMAQRQLPFSGIENAGSVAVAAGTGDVYVSDYGNKRVLVYADDSSAIDVIEIPDAASVYGIAIDGAGNVFVSDPVGNRVFEVAAGSTAPRVLLSDVTGPRGLATDAEGNLYIVESGRGRVLKLPPGATMPIELPFGALNLPSGVAVDSVGNVYITDMDNSRVLKLPVGWRAPMELPDKEILQRPIGIAVDSFGRLLVSDMDANRVVRMPSG